MTEKNNNKKNLNKTDTNNISEQINILRNQVQNAKAIWQDRTHSAIENAKTNFLDITNKINNDIKSIKSNVADLENELIEFQNNVADHNISFLQELLRKLIHLTSLLIPICYIFFSKESMLMVLVPFMFCMVFVDIATRKNFFIRKIYLKLFGFMLRKHEIQSQEMLLNGASWVLVSSVLTIYFFPQIVAVIALSILFISDIVAAVVGRRFGKKRFLGLKGKSVAGTLSFFISAFIVSVIYGIIFEYSIPFFIIVGVASVISALCEAISKDVLKADDNLTIPISFGITMWLGNTYLNYFLGISLF